MAFNLDTAKPVGFNLDTAKPIDGEQPEQLTSAVTQPEVDPRQFKSFGDVLLTQGSGPALIEAGIGLGTSAVLEPFAGIAGLLSLPFTDKPGDIVQSVRDAAFQPRSQGAKDIGQLVAGSAD